MKNETKVHVVRSDKTVAELRDLEYAQQYGPATKKGELFSIAADAIKSFFHVLPGQKQYIAALLLDAHWDPDVGTIRAHAALGGTSDDLQLAIFGSQALQSYPCCIEEVVPAFSDCTKTDTRYVANDCNESGSSWEAANIGIGAHMHEVGHLFGCPHQESGVMLRDYVTLNRTFLVREPYSTRTKSPGLRICRPEDECKWHRLDVLRFRNHPCFRVPSDEQPTVQDESVQFYPIGGGKVMFLAATGISFIEIYSEGEDLCKVWLEFIATDTRSGSMPRQVTVGENDVRVKLPEEKRKKKVKLQIFSGSSQVLTIKDLADVVSKSYVVNLPLKRQAPKKDEGLTMNTLENVIGLGRSFETRQGFKSKKLGFSQMPGSQPQELIFDSTHLQTKLMTSIKVYSGNFLDGLEFCYEDGHSQLFGKRGGKPGGDEFPFGGQRYAAVLDGLLTIVLQTLEKEKPSSGFTFVPACGSMASNCSPALGGDRAFSAILWAVLGRPAVPLSSRYLPILNLYRRHTLIAPRGYSIAGVCGSYGSWVDGLQIIITR